MQPNAVNFCEKIQNRFSMKRLLIFSKKVDVMENAFNANLQYFEGNIIYFYIQVTFLLFKLLFSVNLYGN